MRGHWIGTLVVVLGLAAGCGNARGPGIHGPYRGMAGVQQLTPGPASTGAGALALRMGDASGRGVVDIPLAVEHAGIDGPTAFQTDVRYDPAAVRFERVLEGAIALAANKTVLVNEVRPGHLRLVVTGPDNTPLADGQVATLVFSAAQGLGASTLSLHDVEAVDAGTRLLAAATLDGRVEVR